MEVVGSGPIRIDTREKVSRAEGMLPIWRYRRPREERRCGSVGWDWDNAQRMAVAGRWSLSSRRRLAIWSWSWVERVCHRFKGSPSAIPPLE